MVFLANWLVWTTGLGFAQQGQTRSIEQSLSIAGKNASQLKMAIEQCRQSELEKKSILFWRKYCQIFSEISQNVC